MDNGFLKNVQAELSERALELLALPDDDVPRLLLDIGMKKKQVPAIFDLVNQKVVVTSY